MLNGKLNSHSLRFIQLIDLPLITFPFAWILERPSLANLSDLDLRTCVMDFCPCRDMLHIPWLFRILVFAFVGTWDLFR